VLRGRLPNLQEAGNDLKALGLTNFRGIAFFLAMIQACMRLREGG